jgi:hypothetical protein
MSGDIIVHLGEVLRVTDILSTAGDSLRVFDSCQVDLIITETKKLEVPSARAKVCGNSFSQVSSPYMIRPFPSSFRFI